MAKGTRDLKEAEGLQKPVPHTKSTEEDTNDTRRRPMNELSKAKRRIQEPQNARHRDTKRMDEHHKRTAEKQRKQHRIGENEAHDRSTDKEKQKTQVKAKLGKGKNGKRQLQSITVDKSTD